MLDEHVELLERTLVHQELEAFARSQFAALVLRVDARVAAAFARPPAPLFELFEDIFHDNTARDPSSKSIARLDI